MILRIVMSLFILNLLALQAQGQSRTQEERVAVIKRIQEIAHQQQADLEVTRAALVLANGKVAASQNEIQVLNGKISDLRNWGVTQQALKDTAQIKLAKSEADLAAMKLSRDRARLGQAQEACAIAALILLIAGYFVLKFGFKVGFL